MSVAPRTHPAGFDLLLPALLLTALIGLIIIQLGYEVFRPTQLSVRAPSTVTIASRSFSYRSTGDFISQGASVDAPLMNLTTPPPLEIMTYQVSVADYDRCVTEGACAKAAPRFKPRGDVPVTGVSFHDAEAYARWLSSATGQTWRLPSVAEWAFAAGSRANEEALNLVADSSNPAARWLAEYERQARLGPAAFEAPEPLGHFGVNEFGVADLAGSVWEWTSTCDGRTILGPSGQVLSRLDSCGVRYLEGRHRLAMNVFVRDGRSGGCSISAPPDNLGFRLVRDPAWYKAFAAAWTEIFGKSVALPEGSKPG